MGHLSIAKCACGFESKLLCCAGGEANFTTICDAPVICGDCGKVGTTNLLGDDGALKALDSLCCPSCNSPNIVVVRIPVKLDSDSTPSWTLIPEQAGQSERSDAGFWVFTLLMSLGSSFCRVQ